MLLLSWLSGNDRPNIAGRRDNKVVVLARKGDLLLQLVANALVLVVAGDVVFFYTTLYASKYCKR
jgi:hypothetical protein